MERPDTYHTKEVIPDWANATGAGMAFGMTLGISELVMIPLSMGHFVSPNKQLTISYDQWDHLQQYSLGNGMAWPHGDSGIRTNGQ